MSTEQHHELDDGDVEIGGRRRRAHDEWGQSRRAALEEEVLRAAMELEEGDFGIA